MTYTAQPRFPGVPAEIAFEVAFPGAASYRGISRFLEQTVRERPDVEPAFPYSERHLQCVWADPAYRPALLRTCDGEEVTVQDAGRWNLEAGPDFLDAVVQVEPGHRHVRGDVEIHIRPSDWDQHRHGADPRYRNVALHVTYHPGALPRCNLPNGALQVSLRNDLLSNPAFSFENIDVTSYPYAMHPENTRPCAEVLRRWPPTDRAALLNGAGAERLRIKAVRLAAAMDAHGPDQVLYEEVMAALGYQHNRGAARLLARTLPVRVLRERSESDPLAAYSLLLGVAGLLPTQVRPGWDSATRTLLRQLWDHWWKHESAWARTRLPAGSWRLANLRPLNHPVRRLAGAAGLFAGGNSPAEALTGIGAAEPDEWFGRAASILDAPAAVPYWRNRLSLGGKVQKTDVAILGQGRIAAILSNVAVPFLAATGIAVAPLLPHLPAEEENSLIRRTAYCLFGHDHNPAFYHDGLKQQGLLKIFYDFCLNNRTACRDCALVSAMSTKSE